LFEAARKIRVSHRYDDVRLGSLREYVGSWRRQGRRDADWRTGHVGDNTFRILAVCTANICRSPLMERLLRQALSAPSPAGTTFEVDSAGVRGWMDAPIDRDAAQQLTRLQGDTHDFRSRELTEGMVERADLVLTATTQHRADVLRLVPRGLRRSFTLLEFAQLVGQPGLRPAYGDPAKLVAAAAANRGLARLGDYDLPDPFQQGSAVHAAVADQIAAAVARIAPVLRGDR
jgi:protein-tyrosine phosphatase